MTNSPRAGQPALPTDLVDVPALLRGVLRGPPGPVGSRPARRVRDVRPSRLGVPGRVQRGPHPRDDRGDLPLPRRAGLHRPAVHRPRHPRPVRAGAGGPRSRCSWRTAVDVRVDCRRRLHADAGGLARDPRRQPGPIRRRPTASRTGSSSRRRTTRPTTAASSTTRPTAARPTPTSRAGSRTRRTGSSRRPGSDGLDGIAARPVRAGRATAGAARLHGRATSATSAASWTWTAIAASGLRIGVDPLGGAAVDYWGAIGERYGLDLTVTNDAVDPTFGFMTLDWDGKIRMDPSSPFAMARLVELRDRFDLALGNDADADRHGIVVPGAGLMNPNHVLAAAISYLFGGARGWGARRRRRQDARLVVDHRPRRGRPRAAAGRGPGRLQVVRRRARRRLDRLRRRGERRGVVPAPRRRRSGRPTRTGSPRACWPPS